MLTFDGVTSVPSLVEVMKGLERMVVDDRTRLTVTPHGSDWVRWNGTTWVPSIRVPF